MKQRSSETEIEFYKNHVSRVEVDATTIEINPSSRLYFAGSCFAENLFSYWQEHFLSGALSPFGSTYNPVSLRDSLCLICEYQEVKEEDLFLHNELWRHPLFNTLMADKTASVVTSRINKSLMNHRLLLQQSDFLILTLGTAYVYEEIKTHNIVNNCHRRPSTEFRRYALTVEMIVEALESLMKAVRKINPGIKLILTLSPVRHLRDKASENSLSKALLRCGIEEFLNRDHDSEYFPSYEILLDELRDYRWYTEDLVHPSDAALKYIMSRFCESRGNDALKLYLKDSEALSRMNRHKVLHPDTEEGRNFMALKEAKKQDFLKKYPFTTLKDF
ncbi:GSCFA domain-containing protein [Oceanispirochaeta crateris]|uniref:GSCFA domain-containing protein n=1 Tax=Oceanispirochaeta crateris TaxID=2518645 RepID=UPI00143DFDA7|nr:GSCFA domain-containing protein [Oceanispirochaeta crateris]